MFYITIINSVTQNMYLLIVIFKYYQTVMTYSYESKIMYLKFFTWFKFTNCMNK